MTQTTQRHFENGRDARGAHFVALTPVSLVIRAAEAFTEI
jgi:hypothetical protein